MLTQLVMNDPSILRHESPKNGNGPSVSSLNISRISDAVDFVKFDLIDRIFGVSPYRPQARTGVVAFIQTYE